MSTLMGSHVGFSRATAGPKPELHSTTRTNAVPKCLEIILVVMLTKTLITFYVFKTSTILFSVVFVVVDVGNFNIFNLGWNTLAKIVYSLFESDSSLGFILTPTFVRSTIIFSVPLPLSVNALQRGEFICWEITSKFAFSYKITSVNREQVFNQSSLMVNSDFL